MVLLLDGIGLDGIELGWVDLIVEKLKIDKYRNGQIRQIPAWKYTDLLKNRQIQKYANQTNPTVGKSWPTFRSL